jgi:PKD repeat protein
MKTMRIYKIFLMLAIMAGFASCEKEKSTPQPAADFTYAATAEKPRNVTFTNASKNSETYSWDFGDGSPVSTEESPMHAYTTGGEYTVTLTAIGAAGTQNSVKTIKVTLPNPVNLIKGGDLETVDATQWTILTTTKDETQDNIAVPANYKFGETVNKPTAGKGGGLGFSDKVAGSKSTEGSIFYQEIQLEVGEYQWTADIRIKTGTNKDNAATDTKAALQFWFEVYCGPDKPLEFDGYDKSTLIGGFNYWVAQAPAKDIPSVDGNFSANCVPFDQYSKSILHKTLIDGLETPNKEGKFEIKTAGKYYFCFKVGKWQGRYGEGGIVMDNLGLYKL